MVLTSHTLLPYYLSIPRTSCRFELLSSSPFQLCAPLDLAQVLEEIQYRATLRVAVVLLFFFAHLSTGPLIMVNKYLLRRRRGPHKDSCGCNYAAAAATAIVLLLAWQTKTLVSITSHTHYSSGSQSSTSTTIHLMSNEDRKAMIQECPEVRTLTINEATYSLKGFINMTLHALSHASNDITGSDRPIEHLAKKFDNFKSIKNGFWAEFGVYTGGTLKMAHDQLQEQSKFNGVIAGFDSFEGLPGEWRPGFDKGMFTATYESVRNLVPESVELYKGWFHDTIQDFKATHTNIPAALIHHDGDLFLSTTITLQLLDDRIAPGTHMIFDELIGYKGYENHEILALWLWMNQQGVSLCAMGHAGNIEDLSDWLNPQNDFYFTLQSAWFQVLSRDGYGEN